MEDAGVGAALRDPAAVQEQRLGILGRHNADGQGRDAGAGVGLAEQAGGTDVGDDAAVAVVVLPDHLHRPGQHDTHLGGGISLPEDGLALPGRDLSRAEAAQHGGEVLGADAVKERTALERRIDFPHKKTPFC